MATRKQTPEASSKPMPPYRHEMSGGSSTATPDATTGRPEADGDPWSQALSELELGLRGKESAIVALFDPWPMWLGQIAQVMAVFKRHVMAATKLRFELVECPDKLELRQGDSTGPVFVTCELQTGGLIRTEVSCYIRATAWSLRWLSNSPEALAKAFARLVDGDPTFHSEFARSPRSGGGSIATPLVEPSVSVAKEPEPNLKWDHFESTVVDVLQPAYSICLGPFSPTYVVSRNPRADSSFCSVLRMLANGELTGWETFKTNEEAMMTAETNLRVWGIAPPVVRFDRSVLNETEQKPVNP